MSIVLAGGMTADAGLPVPVFIPDHGRTTLRTIIQACHAWIDWDRIDKYKKDTSPRGVITHES